MQTMLRLLTSRWSLSLLGTAIMALLVWFFAPLVEALEGWVPRLAIVLALLSIWVASNLLLDILRRRRERKLEAGVAERGPASVANNPDEEAAALRERMSTALALLKKTRGTLGYLYEQPWYAIIGPPGAGKTTALLNSGLKFPLADTLGHGAVAGVGGTRLCDWWFTENAVLIDTAGRYTTQDLECGRGSCRVACLPRSAAQDPATPALNGVIVAIALSEIAEAPSKERTAHAREIRARIKELESRLGVRMPVYALFTKADLIAGFTEFFDDLDREHRNQVWGVTFPLDKAERGAVERFPAEFRLLVDRLNQRLFRRLQEESNVDSRALIAAFLDADRHPRTVAASLSRRRLRRLPARPCSDVARYLFRLRNPGGDADRSLDRNPDADLRPGPAARCSPAGGAGAQLLLGRLISEVIQGEAMLVSEPPASRARRAVLRGASFAVIALAVVGAAGWLVFNRFGAEREIDMMSVALAGYEGIAKTATFSPVDDSDLPRLLPLLDAARSLQGHRQPTHRHIVELRLLADRQAAHGRRYGLSTCPGLRVAASADLAAGNPDARQLRQSVFPVRGDPCLSDARRPRPA